MSDFPGYIRGRTSGFGDSLGHVASAFIILSFVLMLMSLGNYAPLSVKKTAGHVQKALLSREKILDNYVERAFGIPSSEWVSFSDFPDDMVIYRYCADTIQSWLNRFPINNDEVDLTPQWYHFTDMNSMNLFNTPLAYLSEGEQYVNLGSAWYLIQVFRRSDIKIIAGLLVKTEYVTQNSVLQNSLNAKLMLVQGYDTVPVYIDGGNVIYGRDGVPLFSLVDKKPLSVPVTGTVMRWIALVCLIMAVFSIHSRRRNLYSLGVTLSVLIASVAVSKWMIRYLSVDNQMFSPTLYADNAIFDSLGKMVIWHLLVFLCTLALFMCRKTQRRLVYGKSGANKWVIRIVSIVVISAYLTYIHLSLKSVLVNSNIVLQFYQINELSVWTFLVYISFGLLYMGLLLCLSTSFSLFRFKTRLKIMSWRGLLIYTAVTAIYTFSMVTYFGFRKEYSENRVRTDNLSLERDLTLEMQLRLVENQIYRDPLLRMLIRVDRSEGVIANRIADQYLWNMAGKYEVRATVCKMGDLVLTENYQQPVDCHNFFEEQIIRRYGVKLGSDSFFWYLHNYHDMTSYVGWWTFYGPEGPVDLYLELDSKPSTDGAIGYPALLLDSRSHGREMLPPFYSYAKYYDGKLVSSSGNYSYSINFGDMEGRSGGYYFGRTDGYLHFCNHISSDGVVVISRPLTRWHQYAMSLSYTYLLFGVLFFSAVEIIRRRNDAVSIIRIRHTFRRKITILLTASLLFALAVMGLGSIEFIIHLTDNTSRSQMQEKLKTVQSSLSVLCKYAEDYRGINNPNTFNVMDRVSAATKVDINLYYPHGSLIRSTKPEIFTKYLASSRMEQRAFTSIVYGSKTSFIQKETIAGMPYYSLYAPIFNEKGSLITVINIPYFLDRSGFRESNSSFIIASIINIYLLLIIFTIFGGVTMANAISRPITQISRRMKEVNISQEPHHIQYKGDDELAVLVRSYNQMVDDVKKSALQLAQSEREQAWREMARQIAHEIKNPLTPMKLSIQHLIRMKKMNVPGWEERLDGLSDSLIEQIDILSNTASEFSSFAKFYNEENTEFDLKHLLREELLLFDSSPVVSVQFRCTLDSAPVKLKKSQITRAFVNLISNAFQALEHNDGGIVRVTLAETGTGFRIDVEDNGSGVSEENRNRLFKPNFTTKSSGTGLGLAITRSIVEQSSGRIWYETSDLGGASFSMELPKKLF